MSGSFPAALRELEDLLCKHIAIADLSEFPNELSSCIDDVLRSSRSTHHWSVQSFLWDLRGEYVKQGLLDFDLSTSRPSDDLWPTIPRVNLESLTSTPLTDQTRNDNDNDNDDDDDDEDAELSFAIRCVDQLYAMICSQAQIQAKSFSDILVERGIIEIEAETVPAQRSGASVNEELKARLTFLEDRVKIIEKRESILQGRLDHSHQAMSVLKATNLDLARKVSELQQRLHDKNRTFNA